MRGESFYFLRGRYCPTDANPETDADDETTVAIFRTAHAAALESYWRAPGYEIVHVVEDPSEDSGGSTYLCSCSGVDTGRHSEWCGLLNLYRPVE